VIFSLTALTFLVGTPNPVPAPPVEESRAELWQVAPDRCEKPWVAPVKPSEKARAVVLIHGLFVHPIRPSKASQPWLRDWQEPKSELVKLLAKDSDVFACGYAQTTPVEDVAACPGLRDAIERLRKAGYKEIVLIGHSAGGIIARQFVERHPDAGVNKVIAVASPFGGVELATIKIGYPKVQAPFVQSLSPEARAKSMKANPKPLDKDVQFACILCKLKLVESDGLVPTRSQWPAEVQRLGVPVLLAHSSHFDVMKDTDTTKRIAELVREKIKRWSPEEVEKAKKILFGEMQK
jgi:pimeloyl-ACP methyl ester carboxylesterase